MAASGDGPGCVLLIGATGQEHSMASSMAGAAAAAAAPGSSGQQPALPWRLDTKYYTAEALLEPRHVDASGGLPLDAYEAVVLVFDAAQHGSWAAAQRWYEAAGGADADLGVRLALGLLPGACSGSGGGLSRPAWLEGAEEWCAEQLVELVEVPLAADGSPAPLAAAPAGGAAAGAAAAVGERQEATGLQRVREALEAHMWPGMQLKPSPQLGTAAAAAAPSSPEAAAAAGVEPAVPQLARQQQQSGAPAGGTAEVGVEDAVPSANGVHPSSGAEALAFSDCLQGPASVGAAAGGEEEEEGEADVERLEQLFAQMASHRAQLAQLPDTERREAAASMVMQLMAALGFSEDEEEGEEGEEGGAQA